ncbi:heparinase II/III family protein [Tranquillimonas alkanivorans]|uniref:Uncharacterized conserved protein, heparinase superfamily n=1 Tax=Tranquillimonas alkanivorans TaxID=441119 RepID=A0A1I5PN64_9RHOB|nr:heparinase II/III family protein [Tranquillimonas alkanivorans]SFP35582.1 Uncharacterized conserved protein, heparinase superfamily [Tranquillimonas alkanivorans]
MSGRESWSTRHARLMNRLHARLSTLSRTSPRFAVQTEPRTMGQVGRGRQLLDGQFLFAGYLVESEDTAPWDLPMPAPRFEAALHGFTWLDDLAADGTGAARRRARDWTHDWVRRYGRGKGPGWTPELTARRLVRCIDHADVLLHGVRRPVAEAFRRSLAHQTRFLARRCRATPRGLPRVEALTALLLAGLALEGAQAHAGPAAKALAREAGQCIDDGGGIASRNPEELLEIFTLLTWASAALAESGRAPEPEQLAAVRRIAPTLRALRHGDGGLPRFHGGGRGAEGRLEHALALSAVRSGPAEGLAMGFARLRHGRTSVILDAAAPPEGEASANGHASTLALEVTSGRRPLIVNCGTGAAFGEKWRRAGRATASHSTLALDGFSSARLGVEGLTAGGTAELLVDAPTDVRMERHDTDLANGVIMAHDGYLATHGLTHVRQVYLSTDGRSLQGEDLLVTLERPDERRFDTARDQAGGDGVPFKVRFHLHPDVEAEHEGDGRSIRLRLRSGEVWHFRHPNGARMSLEASVFLEPGRLSPRATSQIVLSSSAREYATRVAWTLAKAKETPDAVRDLERDELETT